MTGTTIGGTSLGTATGGTPVGGTPVGGTTSVGTPGGGTPEGGGVRIGPGSQIPVGEGRAYAVDGEQVAVFRLSTGALRAVSAICPHAGGPLADGQIDDQVLICPLHLNVFELDTGCSRSGQPALTSYPVHEDSEGQVVIHRTPT